MFIAKVANYFGHGGEKKHCGNGSWYLGTISMKLGKHRVVLEQDKSVVTNKMDYKGTIHTSVISVSGVKSYSEGESIVRDICCLLSLASTSQVVAYQYDFEGHTKIISVRGEAMYFRPLLEIHDGKLIKSYLEQVWKNYRKLKRPRKLAEVIDMLTTCELPKLPLEIQLGQIFIILENLKSTYAKYSGIPFIAGYFRVISSPPKQNPKREPTLSFKDLLEKMLIAENMNPRTKRIINLRNEIVHFGLSRKPYESLRKNYEYCHDIVREYLLRILGYSGDFLIYSEACRKIGKI